MIKFTEQPKKYQVLMSSGLGNVVIKMIETLSNGRDIQRYLGLKLDY